MVEMGPSSCKLFSEFQCALCRSMVREHTHTHWKFIHFYASQHTKCCSLIMKCPSPRAHLLNERLNLYLVEYEEETESPGLIHRSARWWGHSELLGGWETLQGEAVFWRLGLDVDPFLSGSAQVPGSHLVAGGKHLLHVALRSAHHK